MRFVLLLVVALAGCKRTGASAPPPGSPAVPSVLGSAISFGDPTAAFQIERGLWEIEDGSWRWTSGRFVVRLAPPPDASLKGATLKLALTVPEPVITRNHDATLSCAVNAVPMPPETWTTAGEHTLERFVAPIEGEVATLDCQVAKVIPPGEADKRELGLVVRSVRLEPR